jgi:hypothetical protein
VLSPGHSGGCQLHAWPVGANFGAGREAARPGRPSLVVAAAAKAQERKSCYAAAATAAANAAYLVPPPPAAPRHGRSWFKHPSTVLQFRPNCRHGGSC